MKTKSRTSDCLSFLGFRRAVGRPGVRNHLLVLNATGLTGPAARRIAGNLSNALLVSMPYGFGITGSNEAIVHRTLVGLGGHPNVGAVLLLSADRTKAESLASCLSAFKKPIEVIVLDAAERDILTFTDMAVRAGAQMARAASAERRQAFSWSELCIALECGLSDPTSGVASNPLLGRIVDRLLDDGGSALFGETMEWLGCEDRLAARAASAEIADAVVAAVTRREKLAAEAGIDLLGNNPNKANIDAGLSTIEDKALGSIAKSGSRPIAGVLGYGEAIPGPGLYAMDGASYTPESLTGLVAAGAQLALFTSGVGNSYVSALAPTIKVTANRTTAERLREQFDFDCSSLIESAADHAHIERGLIATMLEVASGTLTYGEILGEGDEVISRYGESL